MPSLLTLYLAVIMPAATFIPITMVVYVYYSTSRAQRAILAVAVVVHIAIILPIYFSAALSQFTFLILRVSMHRIISC
jgi:ABC-type transport system involved in cytochrome bd biosynthesis fused ATPase/permease subunit